MDAAPAGPLRAARGVLGAAVGWASSRRCRSRASPRSPSASPCWPALRWRARPVLLTVGALAVVGIAVGDRRPRASLGLEDRSLRRARQGDQRPRRAGQGRRARCSPTGRSTASARARSPSATATARTCSPSARRPSRTRSRSPSPPSRASIGLAAYLLLLVVALSLVLRGARALAAARRRGRGLLRAGAAHARLRRLPGGPADVGAAGRRRRAAPRRARRRGRAAAARPSRHEAARDHRRRSSPSLGALVCLAFIRDPLDGNEQVVHRGDAGLQRPLQASARSAGSSRAAASCCACAPSAAPLTRRPPSAACACPPTRATSPACSRSTPTRHARELPGARRLHADRRHPRPRAHGAPGYEVGFTFTTPTGIGEGTRPAASMPVDETQPRERRRPLLPRSPSPDGRQPAPRARKAAQGDALSPPARSSSGTDRTV